VNTEQEERLVKAVEVMSVNLDFVTFLLSIGISVFCVYLLVDLFSSKL
jgi:hypothetical protein